MQSPARISDAGTYVLLSASGELLDEGVLSDESTEVVS